MAPSNVVPMISRVHSYADSFKNFLAGLGIMGRDKSVSQHWALNVLNVDQLEFAFRGDWIARKIIQIPAFDMTSKWRQWQGSAEQIEALEEAERKFGIQRKVRMAIESRRRGHHLGRRPGQVQRAARCRAYTAGRSEVRPRREPMDARGRSPGARHHQRVVRRADRRRGRTFTSATSLTNSKRSVSRSLRPSRSVDGRTSASQYLFQRHLFLSPCTGLRARASP
jgi:hypothetical protein